MGVRSEKCKAGKTGRRTEMRKEKSRRARKEHGKLKIENFKIQNKRITVNQFKIFYLKFEFCNGFFASV